MDNVLSNRLPYNSSFAGRGSDQSLSQFQYRHQLHDLDVEVWTSLENFYDSATPKKSVLIKANLDTKTSTIVKLLCAKLKVVPQNLKPQNKAMQTNSFTQRYSSSSQSRPISASTMSQPQ